MAPPGYNKDAEHPLEGKQPPPSPRQEHPCPGPMSLLAGDDCLIWSRGDVMSLWLSPLESTVLAIVWWFLRNVGVRSGYNCC